MEVTGTTLFNGGIVIELLNGFTLTSAEMFPLFTSAEFGGGFSSLQILQNGQYSSLNPAALAFSGGTGGGTMTLSLRGANIAVPETGEMVFTGAFLLVLYTLMLRRRQIEGGDAFTVLLFSRK